MDRQQYLSYRQQNKNFEILYHAAQEQKYFEGDLKTFTNKFMLWNIPKEEKQQILNTITDEYDKKFNIVFISYKDKIIKIS